MRLTSSFHGGTDLNAPITRALKMFEEQAWSRADLLLVTDGELGVGEELAHLPEATRSTGSEPTPGRAVCGWECGMLPEVCGMLPEVCGMLPEVCGMLREVCCMLPEDGSMIAEECGMLVEECGALPEECGVLPEVCDMLREVCDMLAGVCDMLCPSRPGTVYQEPLRSPWCSRRPSLTRSRNMKVKSRGCRSLISCMRRLVTRPSVRALAMASLASW